MGLSVLEFFDLLVSVAWRRLRLIVIPIMVFAVIGVVAAKFWPRTYSTRALLMLQERQASDPLAGGGGVTREGRLKAEEIDALIKSERVLASAILDFQVGKKPLSGRGLEDAIKDLKRDLSIGVIGSEFIEVELKQQEKDGLGERLSIILTRFFERLLSREDTMKTARELVFEQRRRDLDSARKAVEGWISRYEAKYGADRTDEAGMKAADLQAALKAGQQKALAAASQLLPGQQDIATLAPAISAEMRMAANQPLDAQYPVQAGGDRGFALKQLLAQVDALEATNTELSKLQLARAQAMANKLAAGAEASSDLTRDWQSLEDRFNETMSLFAAYQQRSRKAPAPLSTPFGLIAPESIRIIDEPRDPTSPTTSMLKILFACLGAGVGLGLGIAALAEQADDRIHSSDDLEPLTGGVPVIRVPAAAA